MNKMKKMVLGAAAAGVLLAGIGAGIAGARTVSWLYGEALRVANPFEQNSGTPDVTLAAGGGYFQGTLEVDGATRLDGAVTLTSGVTASSALRGPYPAVQAIGAGDTITADACGGLKRISSTAARTTSTSDTFTDPATITAPCTFDLVNVSSYAITLDFNSHFVSAGAADVVLGATDTVRIGLVTGLVDSAARWVQIGGTGNN